MAGQVKRDQTPETAGTTRDEPGPVVVPTNRRRCGQFEFAPSESPAGATQPDAVILGTAALIHDGTRRLIGGHRLVHDQDLDESGGFLKPEATQHPQQACHRRALGSTEHELDQPRPGWDAQLPL